MKNQYCKIQNPPIYTEAISRWNNETEANGSELGADIEKLANNDAYLKQGVERLEETKVCVSEKGIRDGIASLGADGKLVQHIEYTNVDNVPAPNWNDLVNKPSVFSPTAHIHSRSQITDFPVALKNPAALTIKMNGTPQGTYDGSAVREINITAGGIGAAASSHTHNYLPLTGGTVTGQLNLISNSNGIKWSERSGDDTPLIGAFGKGDGSSGRQFYLGCKGWSTSDSLKAAIYIGQYASSIPDKIAIFPRSGGLACQLGYSGSLFSDIYCKNGTIHTSDRNKKKDITEFDSDFVEKFIMGITPVSYKYKENQSERTHFGIIAQDIEDLMNLLNMDSKDFAGFIKSPKTKSIDENSAESLSEDIEGEFEYSLRYEEFISPLIKMVQIQQKEMDGLKAEIEKLKEKMQKAKSE